MAARALAARKRRPGGKRQPAKRRAARANAEPVDTAPAWRRDRGTSSPWNFPCDALTLPLLSGSDGWRLAASLSRLNRAWRAEMNCWRAHAQCISLESCAQGIWYVGSASQSRISFRPTPTDEEMLTIAARCPALRELCLGVAPRVTNAGVRAVAQACPRLERLDIEGAAYLTDTAIFDVARRCPKLRHLRLARCVAITGAAIEAIARKCTALESLAFEGALLTRRAFRALATHPKLSSLALLDSSKAGGGWVCDSAHDEDGPIERCLPRVSAAGHFELEGCEQADAVARALLCFAGQRELLLPECVLTGHALAESLICAGAGEALSLTTIDLTYRTLSIAESDQIDDLTVRALVVRCPRLKELRLRGRMVSDTTLLEIAEECPELHTLAINYHELDAQDGLAAVCAKCPRLSDGGGLTLTVEAEAVAVASVCRLAEACADALVELELHAPLTETGTRSLVTHCPRLSILYNFRMDSDAVAVAAAAPRALLSRMTEITVVASAATQQSLCSLVRGCTSILTLELQCCEHVNDTVVCAIANSCPLLSSLDVQGSFVSSRGLRALARSCPRIADLVFKDCCSITDPGVNVIVKSSRDLQSLDVSGCFRITPDVLKTIRSSCHVMQELSLEGCTALSASALDTFATWWAGRGPQFDEHWSNSGVEHFSLAYVETTKRSTRLE